MTERAQLIADMYDALPEENQQQVDTLLKELILAWNPEKSPVTRQSEKRLKQAKKMLLDNEGKPEEDIDWLSCWKGFCLV